MRAEHVLDDFAPAPLPVCFGARAGGRAGRFVVVVCRGTMRLGGLALAVVFGFRREDFVGVVEGSVQYLEEEQLMGGISVLVAEDLLHVLRDPAVDDGVPSHPWELQRTAPRRTP